MNRKRPTAQMKLRLPTDLHGYLKQSAQAAHRTLNAEVVYHLEASQQALTKKRDEGVKQ